MRAAAASQAVTGEGVERRVASIPWTAHIGAHDLELLIRGRLPAQPRAADVLQLLAELRIEASQGTDLIQVTRCATPRFSPVPKDWVVKFRLDPATQRVLAIDVRRRSDL